LAVGSAEPPSVNRQLPTANWKLAAALFVLLLAVYGRTLFNDYIDYDDPTYVSANEVVRHGLTAQGVRYAFTELQPYYWQPLTWLSLELDCTLFGPRPGPEHLVNVLLHALTAALLFLFLQQATGNRQLALVSAAIWAIHPLRVESVAWIAERKDVLSGLFLVAALLAYARMRRVLALVLFALALMSKPTVVTAPLALLALAWWPLRPRRPLLDAAIAAVPAVPIVVLTLRGQASGIAPISIWLRIANAFENAALYLGKFILPVDLSAIYPFRENPGAAAVIAVAVVVAITWAAWHFRRSRPYLAAGWGWYLAMLIPVSGIVQSGAQGMADRFTYIPTIGLTMAAVWLIAEWRSVARPLAVAALLAFCAVSVWYSGLWRDTITLFTHAKAVTGDNPLAHMLLGDALMKENRYDAANAEYAEAVRTSRNGALPLAAAGGALVQQQRYLEAVEPLQRALDLDPSNESARENLAAALIHTGRAASALNQLDLALKQAPSRAPTIEQLRAQAHLALGHTDQAVAQFQKATQSAPSAESWNSLGSAYATKNDFGNAEHAFREAIRLDPKNYDAHMNLGAMLSRAGRNDEALAQVRAAASNAPDSIEPRIYAALIEAQMGRRAEAANDAAEAQQIDPRRANDYFTKAIRIPEKDTNLADFIATMRAR
jgi:tetratricopeptide (TPR) repeat protein